MRLDSSYARKEQARTAGSGQGLHWAQEKARRMEEQQPVLSAHWEQATLRVRAATLTQAVMERALRCGDAAQGLESAVVQLQTAIALALAPAKGGKERRTVEQEK